MICAGYVLEKLLSEEMIYKGTIYCYYYHQLINLLIRIIYNDPKATSLQG